MLLQFSCSRVRASGDAGRPAPRGFSETRQHALSSVGCPPRPGDGPARAVLMKYGLVILVLALVFPATGAFALLNGVVDTSHSAAGVVVDGSGSIRNSAVLIDPFWVLTSAPLPRLVSPGPALGSSIEFVGYGMAAPGDGSTLCRSGTNVVSARDATTFETFLDVQGREVAVWADAWFGTGRHPVRWNGRSDSGTEMPSGLYLVSFRGVGHAESRKILLAR